MMITACARNRNTSNRPMLPVPSVMVSGLRLVRQFDPLKDYWGFREGSFKIERPVKICLFS